MTDEQWQAAWQLYQSGNSIPREQIQSFLSGATGDLLVRDAVLAMLDGNRKVESLDRMGQRIGRYVLTGLLGEGGMGEVYAARDSELGRLVAVKLLAASPAGTSPSVDQFIHEAKAASALNHPSIVTIYEVIHSTSRLAIVMELVDGVALRLLCGTPLPVDRVLHLGEQISRALAAAHAHGIVHCDIKPENLMVRPDGIVKILDFGLARDLASIGSSSILPAGTLRYMSPEQSRGEAPTPASDVFSLGIVLYELAAGVHPFDSGSIFETLKMLNDAEPPAPSSINAFVPAQFDGLVLRMLAKDPSQRPPAAEVARTLGARFRGESPPIASTVTSKKRWMRELKPRWVAASLLAAALAVGFSLWLPPRPSAHQLDPVPEPSVRLDLDLGPNVKLGSTIGPSVILSPDGTRMVFVSQASEGTPRLFTRKLEDARAVQLPGTAGAYGPFFSPDGQWVGFFAEGKLKKIRLDGSEPISLCEAPSSRGASWSQDGTIIAALDQQSGLAQVPSQGGKPLPITELRSELGEYSHRWPQVLPEGKAVLFTACTRYGGPHDDASIVVLSLQDHRTRSVLEHAGMFPRYLPSGHLTYVSKGNLFAVPFNADSLHVNGTATQLVEVAYNPNFGDAQVDFSRTGTLVYRTGRREGLRTLQWLDSSGNMVSLGGDPGYYMFPRVSPDGGRVAYILNEGTNAELWVYDWQRGSKTRLATGQNAYPLWSPDGRFVVFQSAGGIFWMPSDGAGKPRLLTPGKSLQLPASFAPGGNQLVFGALTNRGAEIRTVMVENVSGELRAGESRVYLNTSTIETSAALSPDGRWLAYADAESGTYEVYVRAFPDNGTKVQVSNAGGSLPLWSQSGLQLFYRTPNQRIMEANYRFERGSFVSDKPRVWYGKQLANVGLAVNFDLAPDGKRFLVLTSVETPESNEDQSHIKIATHFFDEVRRRIAGQAR